MSLTKTLLILFTAITSIISATDYVSHIREQENKAAKYLGEVTPTLESHLKWAFRIKFRDVGRISLFDEANSIFELFEITDFYTKMVSELKNFEYRNFENSTLKRQIKILVFQDELFREQDANDRKNEILLRLLSFTVDTKFCQFETKSCEMSFEEIREALTVLKISGGYVNIRKSDHYWKEIIDKTGPFYREEVEKFIKLYQEVAKNYEIELPSNLALREYEDEGIMLKIEAFIKELRPFYEQLHAFVRNLFRKDFGEYVPSEKPIRYDVFQTYLGSYKLPFSQYPSEWNNSVIGVENMTEFNGYTSFDYLKLAEGFFESLNMSKITNKMWRDFRLKTDESCTPSIVDTNARNAIGLYYCDNLKFENFLEIHQAMSQIQGFINTRNLPLAFRRAPWSGFNEGIGLASKLSAASPKYLVKLNMTDSFDENQNIKRMYELAVKIFFNIHLDFVRNKYYLDILNREVGPHGYNCYLWNLLEEYAGIRPPTQRTDNTFDASILHLQSNKIISLAYIFENFVGFKLFEQICDRVGQYEEGNPELPLNKCDFSSKPKAGIILKDIMSYGGSKSWSEILRAVTGDSNFDAKPILKYFEPLHNWLKNYNTEKGIHVGWESSKVCESAYDSKKK